MAVLLLGFAADLQHRRLADGGQHRPELGMGRPDGCAITPQSPAAQGDGKRVVRPHIVPICRRSNPCSAKTSNTPSASATSAPVRPGMSS
ncbi:hypothetical protein G6F66_014785 [Rhizopus arrhizus]|nr:hypothetical protein G6F66_014785 [Rhizopus arrhizus]